jgi:hypothetical protein
MANEFIKFLFLYCFLAHTSENHKGCYATTSPIKSSDIRIAIGFARMRQKAVGASI